MSYIEYTAERRHWTSTLVLALLAFIAFASQDETRAQDQAQITNRILTRADSVATLPSRNKRWALLIGVDKYADSNISPLRGAANDANSLRDVLVKYAGFPADQVVVLSTDEPTEKQPTRTNILKRLSNLSGLVPSDGLLLFSFAGHGIERNEQAFLIPSDATFTEDVSLLEDTAVSVTQIKKRIKDATVQQVLILLDACRSYPTGRSGNSNPLTPAFAKAFDFDVTNREVNAFAVLYATAVGHRAYEYPEKHQGYFSWAIAQALSGAAANNRGEVTLQALVKYLEDNVPKLVALDYGAKVIQKPFAEIEGYRADELILAAAPMRVATSSHDNESRPQVEGNVSRSSAPTATRRPAQAGKVTILVLLSGGGTDEISNQALANEFIFPFAGKLPGLHTTNGLAENPRNAQAMIGSLRKKGAEALIIMATLSLSDLAPYSGLEVVEANGGLELIDSDSGTVLTVVNISQVRGFGNSRDQARRNALKNAAESVSESFIKQVTANAY